MGRFVMGGFAPRLLAGVLAATTAACAANSGAGASAPPTPVAALPSSPGPVTGAPTATPAASARKAAKAHDYNGDGYADLVIGAPEGTVNGAKGAGHVNVVYGSTTGVTGADRHVIGRGGAAVKGEGFGATLASGDIDGDGYADLVIGAPGKGGRTGSVAIAFGGGRGLTDRTVTPAQPEGTIGFGAALAVGDFDHDGHDDLAVATFDTVWVTSGGKAVREGTATWKTVMGPTARVATLAAGDVDGDGFADLAVVYSEDDPADEGTGVVYQGSRSGLAGRLPGTFPGWGVGDVAIGDLDGDGYGDVVAGNAYADAEDEGGQIYVSRGSAEGLRGTRALWTLTSPGMPLPPADTSGFGGAVAVGDVNGDGYADVAVGASGGAGAAFVLYGGKDGLSTRGAQMFDLRSAGVQGDFLQGFGQEVALADLDGNGGAELIVSTRAEERVTVLSPAGGPERSGAGGVGKPGTQFAPEQEGEGFGRPLN
ncbi:FG-GAP repeat protein [Microtetraspora sp. AC03309]|uniref:FG-GAP and VCBS repeat-containing protein n=1 Tax=Microtetraspora sp. AC03309 TaxID=2779376 RepID=UPI001E31DA26|nr:FG-GAP and VCBS repeat-containing protein [Microtetraspora sp. AC03309]MCC5577579.1 FG-GAP repeat protein [Microtetraspora sp. AC03309]